MFKSNKHETIELCDVCFGRGLETENVGNGYIADTGNPCKRCNGTGRILIIETKKIVPFSINIK